MMHDAAERADNAVPILYARQWFDGMLRVEGTERKVKQQMQLATGLTMEGTEQDLEVAPESSIKRKIRKEIAKKMEEAGMEIAEAQKERVTGARATHGTRKTAKESMRTLKRVGG